MEIIVPAGTDDAGVDEMLVARRAWIAAKRSALPSYETVRRDLGWTALASCGWPAKPSRSTGVMDRRTARLAAEHSS